MDQLTHSLTVAELPSCNHQVTQAETGYTAATRERKYLPTLADLVDRLTIAQMKMIFISEHRQEYAEEMRQIMHDIDLILEQRPPMGAEQVRAILILQLSNRFIWENETKIRDGSSEEPEPVQLQRLKATHAINGVRNTAKNMLSAFAGGRLDYKVDCMAHELPKDFGNWRIFDLSV